MYQLNYNNCKLATCIHPAWPQQIVDTKSSCRFSVTVTVSLSLGSSLNFAGAKATKGPFGICSSHFCYHCTILCANQIDLRTCHVSCENTWTTWHMRWELQFPKLKKIGRFCFVPESVHVGSRHSKRFRQNPQMNRWIVKKIWLWWGW